MKSKIQYLIKGELYNPILYGNEEDCWGNVEEDSTCGDCGCKVGEQHLENCDIERCPACGLQFISCDCGIKYEITPRMLPNLPKLIKQQEKDNIENEKRIKQLLENYRKNHKKEPSEM